jgi:hypothetical protein
MSDVSEFRQEPEDPLDRWRREKVVLALVSSRKKSVTLAHSNSPYEKQDSQRLTRILA